MSLGASQLSAMSRLFSSAVFREMAKRGCSSTFARLAEEARIVDLCASDATVGQAFNSAFMALCRVGHRDEYVYKSAIISKILLGRHSLKTASVLSEFRAGKCKADLVILNGSSSAYEIKSERDSLSRLARQIENYQKVFAKVYVIASDDHIPGVMNVVPDQVGILSLCGRFRIATIREATDGARSLCAESIFESLRIPEACSVLVKLGIQVPDSPNTKLHGLLRHIFCQLEPVRVHEAMVDTLKTTRSLAVSETLIGKLPISLQAAALTVEVRRMDHARLVEATSAPLQTAINWA